MDHHVAAVARKALSLPSAPSKAKESCPARESGSAAPSTSTSTAGNSERVEGDSYRTDENLNLDNSPISSSEPDIALHTLFPHSQSSVTNDGWEGSEALNCKVDLFCTVCKTKPPAVTLTVNTLILLN